MIDIKELRIGNYLKYTDTKEIGFVVSMTYDYVSTKDTEIIIDVSKTCDNPCCGVIQAHERSFEPIPLTEDIIRKCGFEHIKGWDEYCLDGFRCGLREKKLICFYPRIEPLEYLHQLQNAYYNYTSTRKELDVNL